MIIGYKNAIDKKFIKRLSDSILPSTRNSERGLSDTRLALIEVHKVIIGYHITFYKKLRKGIIVYQIGFNETFIK